MKRNRFSISSTSKICKTMLRAPSNLFNFGKLTLLHVPNDLFHKTVGMLDFFIFHSYVGTVKTDDRTVDCGMERPHASRLGHGRDYGAYGKRPGGYDAHGAVVEVHRFVLVHGKFKNTLLFTFQYLRTFD